MTRVTDLTEEIEWISRCHGNGDGETHMHLGQYLIEGSSGYVLVDAGEGHDAELNEEIEAATGGAGIDVVLLTHSILPHTGNVAALKEAWEDATVIAAVGNPAAVGIDAEPSVTGETEEVAGATFTFIDPLITDVVVSTWIYHHESSTLFTSEGVGHYHAPGECTHLSTDYEDGVPFEYVRAFAADKLKFLDFVDPEKLRIGFDNLLAEYDVERIAPTHGAPIERGDIERYADTLARAAGEFDYEPTGVGGRSD